MELLEAKKIMDEKLGDYKIMALASCVDDYPMVRNVSCVFYNDKIYFKTDKNFRKTQQLFKNNKCTDNSHIFCKSFTCIRLWNKLRASQCIYKWFVDQHCTGCI